MRFVRQLDDDEVCVLETMRRTAVGQVSQRAHMVLLSNRHYCIAEIARVFDASENTVRQWIERYKRDGVDCLDDRPRSGRPPKVSAAVQAAIHEDVLKPPSELGHAFAIWTAARLCVHVAVRYGARVCTSTVYSILRGLGFRHNRPRNAAKRAYDPQAKAKMDAVTEVLSSPVAGNHVIYKDESDIHLLPTLRSAWMPQGKQLRVSTPGANQKKSVFGALDIRIGAFIHRMFDRKRATEFIEFLAYMVAQYPTGKIHIILDNFSTHKARSVQAWLASHPRVKLYSLPCYMPQLNPVEKVWWHMKAVVTANRLYGSMAALVDAVSAFFEQLSPSRVQTLAA